MQKLFEGRIRTAAATALVVLVLAVSAGALPASAGATRAAPRWAGPTGAALCGVGEDGNLWCTNASGAPLRDKPSIDLPSSETADYLRTTYSWFTCWSEGQYHRGGNTTWYYTQGDDLGHWGWVAAEYVNTTDHFDSNPSNYGIRKCQYPWS